MERPLHGSWALVPAGNTIAAREMPENNSKQVRRVRSPCPCFAGPIISARADGVSRGTITTILEGGEVSPAVLAWIADVRDVARAPVPGAEVPSSAPSPLVPPPPPPRRPAVVSCG